MMMDTKGLKYALLCCPNTYGLQKMVNEWLEANQNAEIVTKEFVQSTYTKMDKEGKSNGTMWALEIFYRVKA